MRSIEYDVPEQQPLEAGSVDSLAETATEGRGMDRVELGRAMVELVTTPYRAFVEAHKNTSR